MVCGIGCPLRCDNQTAAFSHQPCRGARPSRHPSLGLSPRRRLCQPRFGALPRGSTRKPRCHLHHDLDRCTGLGVAETLRAIGVLVNEQTNVTVVMAIDRDRVAAALASEDSTAAGPPPTAAARTKPSPTTIKSKPSAAATTSSKNSSKPPSASPPSATNTSTSRSAHNSPNLNRSPPTGTTRSAFKNDSHPYSPTSAPYAGSSKATPAGCSSGSARSPSRCSPSPPWAE